MTAITVPDKVTGNTLTAAEFQQFLDALKNGTLSIITDGISAKNAQIGDATNYAAFAADGELTLHGTARAKKTIQFAASEMKSAGISPATEVVLGLDGALAFAKNADDNGSFSFFIRDEMDRTVAPTVRLGWSSPAIVGDVKWQIQYLWRGLDEDTGIVTPDATVVDIVTVSGTTNGYKLANFTLIAPSGTDRSCQVKITRLGTEEIGGADDVANVIVAVVEYTSDKLGTGL